VRWATPDDRSVRRYRPIGRHREGCYAIAAFARLLTPPGHDLVVEFSYRLTGTGWGEARVADDRGPVELPTSYLTDVLGELLLAVGAVLEGATRSECSWEGEPGEYRWVFEQVNGRLTLRILAFSDAWPRQDEHEGTVVFETSGNPRDIVRPIVEGIASVLADYGEDEYRRKWVEAPFPTEALRMVEALLAQ
jgi:hypothetical protein